MPAGCRIPIQSSNMYYPCGSSQPGRYSQTAVTSRYSFQGQEKYKEIRGEGNSLNFKYRIHDARIGRFFALDPLSPDYPHNSPYAFSENRVIDGVELERLKVALLGFRYSVSLGVAGEKKKGTIFRPDGVGEYEQTGIGFETDARVVPTSLSVTIFPDMTLIDMASGEGTSVGGSSDAFFTGFGISASKVNSGDYAGISLSIDYGFTTLPLSGNNFSTNIEIRKISSTNLEKTPSNILKYSLQIIDKKTLELADERNNVKFQLDIQQAKMQALSLQMQGDNLSEYEMITSRREIVRASKKISQLYDTLSSLNKVLVDLGNLSFRIKKEVENVTD